MPSFTPTSPQVGTLETALRDAVWAGTFVTACCLVAVCLPHALLHRVRMIPHVVSYTSIPELAEYNISPLMAVSHKQPTIKPETVDISLHSLRLRENPVFVGVVGGPGSRASTQCQLLSEKFRAEHVCIGNILYEEVKRAESPWADIIRKNRLDGCLVPEKIVVPVLKKHIEESIKKGVKLFLLDGTLAPKYLLTCCSGI